MSVADAISATGIGKTTLYALINNNSLRSIKVGKKRLIVVESLLSWLAAMETESNKARS
jgi:excisionase family DNA binding protein